MPKWNHVRKVLLDPLYWIVSKRELLRHLRRETVDDIVAATTHYRGRGFYKSIRAYQSQWEVTELAKLVQSTKPRVIVEIGTYRGGTLWVWCRSNKTARKIVSIDLPEGEFGGGYDERRAALYQLFVSDRRTELCLLRGNSHDAGTRTRLEAILDGDSIDSLFLDADHTYEGVEADFASYAAMVRTGGIIAFHDTNTTRGRHEVHLFWKKLSDSHKHVNIVERSEAEGNGIGVIFK